MCWKIISAIQKIKKKKSAGKGENNKAGKTGMVSIIFKDGQLNHCVRVDI